MIRYVFKRILLMIPVIIGVSFLVYFILDLAPGDAADLLAPEGATIEEIEELRDDLGLNDSIFIRYGRYMSGLVRGDLGQSYITDRDVFQSYLEKLPATIKLAFASIFVSILLSIPLGIYSATHQGSISDNVSMVTALVGLSMPNFWLGLLLILLFSLKFNLLPSGGAEGFASIILPALTIGTGMMATLTRTTRSSMLDVVRQDYLRTARAKGVTEKKVINQHALKNALIPIITIIGTQLAGVLGGSVLTETVFSWPGIGRLIVDSLNSRDTPMVTGCIILTTITLSFILLLVDLLYAVVDPRIKAQYSSNKGGKSNGNKAKAAA